MTKPERIKRGQEIFDYIRQTQFESRKKGRELTHIIVPYEDQQCVLEWGYEERHICPITDSGVVKLCGLEFIGSEENILRLK